MTLVDRLFWLEVKGFQMGMVCIPAASEACRLQSKTAASLRPNRGDPGKSSSEKQNKTESEGFPPVPGMKRTHEPWTFALSKLKRNRGAHAQRHRWWQGQQWNCSWDKQPSDQVSFLDFFPVPGNRRCFRKGWVGIPHGRFNKVPRNTPQQGPFYGLG